MASAGEEGRGKLRKAAGSCKQASIRRYPNGATRADEVCTRIERYGPTQGTETSQYLQEEKESIDFLSSGERKGKSPNRRCYGSGGVVGAGIKNIK